MLVLIRRSRSIAQAKQLAHKSQCSASAPSPSQDPASGKSCRDSNRLEHRGHKTTLSSYQNLLFRQSFPSSSVSKNIFICTYLLDILTSARGPWLLHHMWRRWSRRRPLWGDPPDKWELTPAFAVLGWTFSLWLKPYPVGVIPAPEEIKHPCDVLQAGVGEHSWAGTW